MKEMVGVLMSTNILIMSLFIITVVVQVIFMIIRSIYYRKLRLYCNNNDETDRKSSNLCKYYSEATELYGILIYQLEKLYSPLLILFIVMSSVVTVLFLLYY